MDMVLRYTTYNYYTVYKKCVKCGAEKIVNRKQIVI